VTLRKVCPQCQTIVDKDSLFCEKCGANLRAIPVTEIRCCPNCGKLLDADALFCDGCGAKVETGSLASALTQPEVDSDKGRNTISEQVSVTDKTIVDHPSMPGPETVGTMQQPVAPVPVTVTQSTTSSVHAKLQKLGDYAPEVSGTDVTNYAILIITFITDFIIVSVFWFWVIGIFAPGPNAASRSVKSIGLWMYASAMPSCISYFQKRRWSAPRLCTTCCGPASCRLPYSMCHAPFHASSTANGTARTSACLDVALMNVLPLLMSTKNSVTGKRIQSLGSVKARNLLSSPW
jgi:RNA polymerase subunit RPABC4/transcription elongation factor Spt4